MREFRIFNNNKGALEATETDNTTIVQAVASESLGNAWDVAHAILDNPKGTGLDSAEGVNYVEPDFDQSFIYKSREPENALESLRSAETCSPRLGDSDWPNDAFGWHLGNNYSQLRQAREFAGIPESGQRIRVAIIDTGYDPGHASLPSHVSLDLARNFSGRGADNDASDPGSAWPSANPGHGTATMALLAGGHVRSGDGSFDEELGGAPHVEVIPIRIADSVIVIKNSAMAKAIRYAADHGCQIVSISMGGIPTREWAEAVNYAYDRGVTIFAAAGNRIGGSPPATLVYPARFRRVVGVCGFTADKKPYYLDGWHFKMHGSFGPESVMGEAMAAYTPNIPWAAMGCGELVNPDGAGTSSATPQCAAAAALWLQTHPHQPTHKWMTVEAIRKALFSTTDTSPEAGRYYFGNGLLQARAALDVAYAESGLTQRPRDSTSFPWLRILGALEAAEEAVGADAMLETEALQHYMGSLRLQDLVDRADPQLEELTPRPQKKLLSTMSELPAISSKLRTRLKDSIQKL